MQLEKYREYTVNMGNYESLKIGARVTVDSNQVTEDSIIDAEEFEHLNQLADLMLTKALEEDLQEAKELTQVRDSYVLSWKTG